METATDRKWMLSLTLVVLLCGAMVVVAYLAGWITPRTCEGLSAIPCFAVAGWYARLLWSGRGSPLYRWGWWLLSFGWSLVGVAFLLPAGIGRWVVLSSAVPTLLIGFGTTLLANWYSQSDEGGTVS